MPVISYIHEQRLKAVPSSPRRGCCYSVLNSAEHWPGAISILL